MKRVILWFIIGIVGYLPGANAQTVSGRISVTGFNNETILKEQNPVQLFKSFKDNKYKIGFSFKGSGIEREGIVLFDMKTTVRKNGKVIGSSTRPGWPWIPGDMFLPAEAFDFIPMLQKDASPIARGSKVNKLAGNYEIILEMNVSSEQDISGSVSPVTVSFKFQ